MKLLDYILLIVVLILLCYAIKNLKHNKCANCHKTCGSCGLIKTKEYLKHQGY